MSNLFSDAWAGLQELTTGGSGGGETFSQAQSNYTRQQVTLAATLQRRLKDGTMSQDVYDQQITSLRNSLDDPSDAAWTDFNAAVQSEIVATGTFIADIPGKVAGGIGSTIGDTFKSFFSGIFGSLGIVGWIVLIGFFAIIVWAFVKGPLSSAKVKTIPLPI